MVNIPQGLELLITKIKKELKGKNNPRTNKPYSESDMVAIATNQWNKSKKKEYAMPDNTIIETYSAIKVSEGFEGAIPNPTTKNNTLEINGIAINAGITRNNVKYIEEELRENATSLIGAPIMKNHSNKVEDIIGRVTSAGYDEGNKRIPYTGNIMDRQTIEMIKDGRINQVSIRASYKKMEVDKEDEDVVIVKGLNFLELSAVAIAGDPNATLDFNTFVSEAYDEKLKEEINKMTEEVKKEETKISDEMKSLKETNNKLSEELETLKKSIKEEDEETAEPEAEPEKEVEPKLEDDAEMTELKKRVKELEESLLQGKGKVAEATEKKESEFVREYIPGEGMTIYKRGVI